MFDVVIDATGNPQSMATALTYAAHGGTVVFLGLTRQEIAFAQPEMHRRELTLLATRNALPEDFRQVIDAIAGGTIDTGHLDHPPHRLRRGGAALRCPHPPGDRRAQGGHRPELRGRTIQ